MKYSMKSLPLLRDLVICREASTHDRRGGNDNGFSNKAEFVRRERGVRVTVMDVAGPGSVKSFWYSWPNHPLYTKTVERAWARWIGNVRFFFNGEDRPRLETPLRELVGAPPFIDPLAIHARKSTGGYFGCVPMPFEDGLRISIDGGGIPMFFYHFWYHCYPWGTKVESWTGDEDLSDVVEQWKPEAAENPGGRLSHEIEDLALAPGESREIFSTDRGGTIGCLRIKLPEDDLALRSTRLQAFWDGETEPSIDAPLSLLFAVENRYKKEPAAIAGSAEMKGPVIGRDRGGMFYFRLPMPFSKRARLCLVNKGGAPAEFERIGIEYDDEVISGLGESAGYLRTEFRESRDLTPGRDYLLAHLHGRGHIVGTVMAVAAAETFLEGDERVYTDGGRSPLIMGDATETYFNGSWYFMEKGFACPLHGAPTFRMKRKIVGTDSEVTMYRFHLTDLIPFRSEARFSMQHGGFNDVPGHYRSLVFYYGLPDKSLSRTDYLSMSDQEDRVAHSYSGADPISEKERAGFFEGDFNGQDLGLIERPGWFPPIVWNLYLTVRGIFHDPPDDSPDRISSTVCEHDGAYEFTVKIDPDNSAVMLRRLFDQSIPDQRANIEVDGKLAGIWYNAGRNKRKIWSEDDLILDPSLTKGKSEIRIKVVPASPTFTAVEYTVFSIEAPGTNLINPEDAV